MTTSDQYIKLIEGQARIEQKIDIYKEIQDKHAKDIRALNKFKWGVVGTAFFSSLAVLKAWFGVNS